MEPIVLAAVLLAALLHAGWNALVKADRDRLIAMATVSAGSGVAALVLLPLVAAPAPASWPFIAASLGIHLGYQLFLVRAYGHGELGQVYPIARGAAPLLVALGAAVLVGERLAPGPLAGVALVALGIASLARTKRSALPRDPRPVLYALGTAVFIAGYTVVDGSGARLAGSAHGYALWFFALNALPVAAVVAWRRGLGAWRAAGPRLGLHLAGGVMSLVAYWLVIWALTRGAMAPVAALREVSVLIAAVIGAALLKERLGRARIAAALAIVVGIALLSA